MKNTNKHPRSIKSQAFGLALAALAPTGAALADHRDVQIGGEVVVTKQIPGGVITVGATIGQPRPTVVHEKVVVVQEPAREKVIIVEKEPVREKVVIVKEKPACEKVVVVREREPEKVVIIEKRGRHGKKVKKIIHYGDRDDRGWHGRDWDDDDRGWMRGRGRGHDYHGDHARQVSIQHQDGHGNSHYYRDANQVSKSYSGPEGNYHYYEDANQVSIQDTRYGQNKHVYVRK